MRNLNLSSLLLVIMSVCFTSCNQKANDPEADKAAIIAVYEAYISYAEAGDLDNFIELWDDNATRSEPGVPLIIGKEDIKEAFRQVFEPFNYKFSPYGDYDIEVYGDIAISFVAATLESTPKEGGPASKIDIKASSVFKRQPDGDWKLYRDCINFHPTWSMDSVSSDLMEDGNPYY